MDKNKNSSEGAAAIAASLQSAGLSGAGLQQFLELWASGSTPGQIKILRKLRLELLEEIHARQKSLDIVDYIIYKIRQGTL